MPKKILKTLAFSKFNKTFMKKNPNVLFALDVSVKRINNKGHKVPFDFVKNGKTDLKNVLLLDLSKIKDDKDMEKNKKELKIIVKTLVEKSKNFKHTVVPPNQIGFNLIDNEKAPKSFTFLRALMRPRENTIMMKETKDDKHKLSIFKGKKSGSSLSLGDSKKGKSKSKKTQKKLKKKKKKSKKAIKKALKSKKCSECKEFSQLLAYPLKEKNDPTVKKFLTTLEKGEKYCDGCIKKCKKISDNFPYLKNDKDLVKAQFPTICRKDHTGKNEATRVKTALHTKLLTQLEVVQN